MTSTRSRPNIAPHPLIQFVAAFRSRWDFFRTDVERYAPTANIGFDRIEQVYALNGKLTVCAPFLDYLEFVVPSFCISGVPTLVTKHFPELSSAVRFAHGGILNDPETFYWMSSNRRERLVERIVSVFGTTLDQHPETDFVAESEILSALKDKVHNPVPADVTVGEFRGAMIHCLHTPASLFHIEWKFRVSMQIIEWLAQESRRQLARVQRIKVSS